MEFLVFSRDEWQSRAALHVARLEPFVEEHRARRKRGEKHPVWDFLWEYYSFKPSHLLRWSPGVNVELRDASEFAERCKFAERREFARTANGWALDGKKFPIHRIETARETLQLLEATASRAPFFGCFGLHEWAMVYREEEFRHQTPLRLSGAEIAEFVESQTVRCSHYDAFRFFTPSAVPLNVLNPQSENRAEFEQPACIHATMDLYKWAYKFAPWMASEILADAFLLARAAREIDMRASPYDLRAFGFEPIRLETSEGRLEYVRAQRQLVENAVPLRARLIEAYRNLLKSL